MAVLINSSIRESFTLALGTGQVILMNSYTGSCGLACDNPLKFSEGRTIQQSLDSLIFYSRCSDV